MTTNLHSGSSFIKICYVWRCQEAEHQKKGGQGGQPPYKQETKCTKANLLSLKWVVIVKIESYCTQIKVKHKFQCTMYNSQCTNIPVHHRVQCTMSIVKCEMSIACWTMFIIQWTLNIVQRILNIGHRTMSVHCTLYNVQCTTDIVYCTMEIIQWKLYIRL